MTTAFDPNPPSRKDEDFPKTTTIPEGWISDALMETYNHTGPVPTTGGDQDGNSRPAPVVDDESLFRRQLDPFPKPNTIPSGWDMSGL